MAFQKLQAWQDKHGVSDSDLARRVTEEMQAEPPVHQTTISRAKAGKRLLGMELQLAIQKITKIPPAEWADFYAQTVSLRTRKPPTGSKKNATSRAAA